MTTITVKRSLLEKLYLYWIHDVGPDELDDFNDEVRAALVAPATAPDQPAWHDAPTVEGVWLNSINRRSMLIWKHELATWGKTGARWYGPIPQDGEKS